MDGTGLGPGPRTQSLFPFVGLSFLRVPDQLGPSFVVRALLSVRDQGGVQGPERRAVASSCCGTYKVRLRACLTLMGRRCGVEGACALSSMLALCMSARPVVKLPCSFSVHLAGRPPACIFSMVTKHNLPMMLQHHILHSTSTSKVTLSFCTLGRTEGSLVSCFSNGRPS